jgi:starvation-inducible DNA-binding protein
MPNKIETEFREHPLNFGISEKKRRQVCKGLSKVLADSYFLYLKTQNYHWNVTGNMFQALHQIFEVQYQDLGIAIDLIAERIRILGEFAPASFSVFNKLTSIKEETGIPTTEEMIYNLVQGNETVVTTARDAVSVCDEAEDDVTIDLMVQRMKIHEKNSWILRSMLPSSMKSH